MTSRNSPVFELRLKKQGILATAQEIDGEFTVLADSTARLKWTGAGGHNYRGLREKLERDGTLVPSLTVRRCDSLTARYLQARAPQQLS